MAIARDIVQKYIETAIKSEMLEDSFMSFSIPRDPEAKSNDPNCPGVKKILLTISTSSEPDKIIKHYVNLMASVKSSQKFDSLFNNLYLLLNHHSALGKPVCEALLSCCKIDYSNERSWLRAFNLITEILPTVDYKGVRDILKHILELIYQLPERFDTSMIARLDSLYATFATILDSEACLLPAYLSLDELQKKIAQGGTPIWKFAELFYHFIDTFRPTAQIFTIVNRSDLLPVVGFSSCQANPSWWLDGMSAKFQLKGLLPYKDKLKEPQVGQLKYLLEQPYSREMIFNTLSLGQKPSPTRCPELVEQIAITLIHAMERSEPSLDCYVQKGIDASEHLFQWLHLSNNVLFHIAFNQAAISFNLLIDSLCEKIKTKNLKRGREHLMWAMLQYVTGGAKSSISDLVPVLKLIDVLYIGRTPIPLPSDDFPFYTHTLAAASVWFQLVKRAESDQVRLCRPLPPALSIHYNFISRFLKNEQALHRITSKDAAFLNAYSTTKNAYPISDFVDCLCKVDPIHNPYPIQKLPLPLALLDSLTAHSKMSLLHALAQRIVLIAQNKPGLQTNQMFTPALVETYGRLLIYTDSESFGLKSFIGFLLGGPNAVWKSQAWHIYHVLLEMYNYRVQHVSLSYKFQMLLQLHNLSPMVYSANQMQLTMTMEATELKLLLGMSNSEPFNLPVTPRHSNESKPAKNMINSDSEELNKVLVLVFARATHISANEHVFSNYLEEILEDINRITPLSWSSSTLNFFPPVIREYFLRKAPAKETDRAQLRPAVEEEYRKWKAMANDSTLVEHFSQPNGPPLFICVLWKMLLDNDQFNPVVYKILDNIRIRTISTHLRNFVDYLVYEFANSVAGQHVNKYAEALSDLIWKHQIISLDRLILCMCLRSFDGCELQVCFFIIQLLLLKISDFPNIVQNFCKMQTPEHWKPNVNCYEVNSEFQRRYPEKYYHDFLAEHNIPSMGQTMPSFFGNVCLRFIPVFDILIHRAIELRISSPNAAIKIDALLDEFGCLYRFHDKPLTYLYNTLHYYDARLSPALKRKLTATIVGAFRETRPANWCLSEIFTQYLSDNASSSSQIPNEEWCPNPEYYRKVVGRLVDVLQNKNVFYHTDWRYNEFLNAKSHAIHATAIELMSLPQPSNVIAQALLDIVLTGYVNQDRSTISHWMNAIGLIMTALPIPYYTILHNNILDHMRSPLLTSPIYTKDILHLMNFCDNHERMYESRISYLVALTHAIWHHSNAGQIFCLPNFWREEIKQAVETESQFLFACCLIGPFLQRLEFSRAMVGVVLELYEMLGRVDKNTEIEYLNTICNFFYHIKYMFTGDAIKTDIEKIIRSFKPKLQYSLRFITHLNIATEQGQTQKPE